MVFQAKKVPMETLGEYLTSIRTQLKLTSSEVANETGIAEKFLLALESGTYNKLPPSVYVCGFLKKLALRYSISEQSLVEQYKKEQGIIAPIATRVEPKKTFSSRIKNLSITPKLISIAGASLVLLIAFGYIVFQVSAINGAPKLVLSEPKDGAKIQDSIIRVKGETELGALLTINGENVLVQPDGKFEATIGAVPGQRELTLVSKSKFGKETTNKVLVVVEDQTSIATKNDQQVSDEKKLNFEIVVKKNSELSLIADGTKLPTEQLVAGSTKTISVEKDLVINSSDAGNTNVRINGKDFGVLGRPGEKISVPFNSDSVTLITTKTLKAN